MKQKYPYLARCLRNLGNEMSLERGKTYSVIAPRSGDPPRHLRVIDEGKEDYLYPSNWFVAVEVPSPPPAKK